MSFHQFDVRIKKPLVQQILIVIAVLCIPVMLLTKPLILLFRHKKKSQVRHPHTNFLLLLCF